MEEKKQMKHTKKRALLSAIAMLIVSAVVLSSATFAWFIAGTTATVTGIQATVSSGSSVQVSAEATANFANTIDMATLALQPGNHFPGALTAVSTGLPVADNAFFLGELTNGYAFTSTPIAGANIGNDLVKFTVYVRCSTAGSVTLTGTNFATSGNSMVYGATQIDGTGTPKIWAADNTIVGYTGFTTAVTGADANHDGIISASERTAGSMAAVVPLGNIQTLTIPFTGAVDETHSLTIWMWLEGQDPQTAGSVTATPGLSLVFNAP
jgi:hypothetical protein